MIQRIISGGQTGVDRAALDTAIELGIPHGGWCPAGRRAEDGQIPSRYTLQERHSRNYADRTLHNVLDGDGTLILFVDSLTGGTQLTSQLARKHNKPVLELDLAQWLGTPPTVYLSTTKCRAQQRSVYDWVVGNAVRTLNVAGPRESTHPGIGVAAATFLKLALTVFVSPEDDP